MTFKEIITMYTFPPPVSERTQFPTSLQAKAVYDQNFFILFNCLKNKLSFCLHILNISSHVYRPILNLFCLLMALVLSLSHFSTGCDNFLSIFMISLYILDAISLLHMLQQVFSAGSLYYY